jgi:HSP20 family protein
MDRFFDDFDWPLAQVPQQGTSQRMLMDVKETKDSYELIVDLPGVESKDIDIKLRDDQLVINAHRETTKKEEGEHFHRVERRSGHITRSMVLPPNADRESIEAENKNGVLHIKMKKTEHPQENEKKIEIKQASNA